MLNETITRADVRPPETRDDACRLNSFDVADLHGLIAAAQADPAEAKTVWRARTEWQGRARTRTTIGPLTLGSKTLARDFAIDIDEPEELAGGNAHPNPQDVLLAALNGCVAASFAAICTLQGVRLDRLEVETEGEIDLRGFLGLAPVAPGYEALRVTIRAAGDASPEQFAEIHAAVRAASPNMHTVSRPVRIDSVLEVA